MFMSLDRKALMPKICVVPGGIEVFQLNSKIGSKPKSLPIPHIGQSALTRSVREPACINFKCKLNLNNDFKCSSFPNLCWIQMQRLIKLLISHIAYGRGVQIQKACLECKTPYYKGHRIICSLKYTQTKELSLGKSHFEKVRQLVLQ